MPGSPSSGHPPPPADPPSPSRWMFSPLQGMLDPSVHDNAAPKSASTSDETSSAATTTAPTTNTSNTTPTLPNASLSNLGKASPHRYQQDNAYHPYRRPSPILQYPIGVIYPQQVSTTASAGSSQSPVPSSTSASTTTNAPSATAPAPGQMVPPPFMVMRPPFPGAMQQHPPVRPPGGGAPQPYPPPPQGSAPHHFPPPQFAHFYPPPPYPYPQQPGMPPPPGMPGSMPPPPPHFPAYHPGFHPQDMPPHPYFPHLPPYGPPPFDFHGMPPHPELFRPPPGLGLPFVRPSIPTCITTAPWNEDGEKVYQITLGEHVICRRTVNSQVNGTKLLNFAGVSRGKRDATLKNEKNKEIRRSGPLFLKGVWLPLERARALATQYDVYSFLDILLCDDPSLYVCTQWDHSRCRRGEPNPPVSTRNPPTSQPSTQPPATTSTEDNSATISPQAPPPVAPILETQVSGLKQEESVAAMTTTTTTTTAPTRNKSPSPAPPVQQEVQHEFEPGVPSAIIHIVSKSADIDSQKHSHIADLSTTDAASNLTDTTNILLSEYVTGVDGDDNDDVVAGQNAFEDVFESNSLANLDDGGGSS